MSDLEVGPLMCCYLPRCRGRYSSYSSDGIYPETGSPAMESLSVVEDLYGRDRWSPLVQEVSLGHGSYSSLPYSCPHSQSKPHNYGSGSYENSS